MSVARISEREQSYRRRRELYVVQEDQRRFQQQPQVDYAAKARSNKVIGNVVIISIMVFVFLASIAFVSVLWQISAVQRDILVLEKEIYEINRENRNLESVISTAANIESVRENAHLLGMSSPTEEQIEEIYVGENGVINLSASHNN